MIYSGPAKRTFTICEDVEIDVERTCKAVGWFTAILGEAQGNRYGTLGLMMQRLPELARSGDCLIAIRGLTDPAGKLVPLPLALGKAFTPVALLDFAEALLEFLNEDPAADAAKEAQEAAEAAALADGDAEAAKAAAEGDPTVPTPEETP